jgi:hypothetical protein
VVPAGCTGEPRCNNSIVIGLHVFGVAYKAMKLTPHLVARGSLLVPPLCTWATAGFDTQLTRA